MTTVSRVLSFMCGSSSQSTNNEIVIFESKFQFCCNQVEFAGLTVTNDGVQPLQKTLTAIQEFPIPTDLSSAMAWFGPVNQVQSAYANSEDMVPLQDLVRPSSNFLWDQHLTNKLFSHTTSKIIDQVRQGIIAFDISWYTCLQTEWSKRGTWIPPPPKLLQLFTWKSPYLPLWRLEPNPSWIPFY